MMMIMKANDNNKDIYLNNSFIKIKCHISDQKYNIHPNIKKAQFIMASSIHLQLILDNYL